MKMLMGENLRIMVGGQVVGMAKEAKFSIAEDDASTKEFSDPWRTPDIKQSWDITGNAMVRDAGDVLRDLLNGKEKWDVTIGQEVGKLPRKMKKALHSKRMTKWKRKVAAYINRRQIRIRDAEMVVTPDQFDTLKATISGGTIEHGCVVSGKQISEALERYRTTAQVIRFVVMLKDGTFTSVPMNDCRKARSWWRKLF